MNTTPKSITPQILELCKRLDASQSPVFVPVQPVPGAIINECYGNVKSHVKRHGGSLQHGWIIWENPEIIIEGNFHACWVNTAGKLVDISPKQDGEKEILFLPDSVRVYNGTPIDNEREILTKDPALIKSFKMQEQLAALRAKYNVDGQLANIPVHELVKIGYPVPTGSGDLFADLSSRTPARRDSKKVGRNELCPCGSGVKFKKCCGK